MSQCLHPACLQRIRPHCDNRGFALVIALMLMAFILLLMLSLTTLNQVELQTSNTENAHKLARQNALLGMLTALGELQAAAGPDERITATAQIDRTATPQDGTRYWTGVWENAEPADAIYTRAPRASFVRWLVSAPGNPTPGMTLTDENSRLLVGEASLGGKSQAEQEQFVRVPVVAIGEGDDVSGRFAWWVGDEGVKARFDLIDQHARRGELTMPNLLTESDRYRAATAQRNGIELLYPADAEKAYPINSSILEQLIGWDHIGEIDVDKTLRGRFQHLSPYSLGLLTNTLRGGLRGDLSFLLSHNDLSGKILPEDNTLLPEGSALQGPYWERLKSYRDQVISARSGGVTAQVADKDTHGLTPVLVKVSMLIRPYAEAIPGDLTGRGKLSLRVTPVFVIANPYNATLNLPTGLDITFYNSDDGTLMDDRLSLSADTNYPGPYLFRYGDTTSLLGGVRFRTGALSIPPGEAVILSLDEADPSVFALGTGSSEPVSEPSGTQRPIRMVENNFDPFLFYEIGTGIELASQALNRNWTLRCSGPGHMDVGLFPIDADPKLSSPYQSWEWLGLQDNQVVVSAGAGFPVEVEDGVFYLMYPLFPRNTDALRLYADHNIRSQRHRRTYAWNTNSQNASVATGNPRSYDSFGADLTAWGPNRVLSWGGNVTEAVLFDLQHLKDGSNAPIPSIAALQHADLSADTFGVTSVTQPAYIVGNALASPYLPRETTSKVRRFGSREETYYDMSYLLNSVLWDGYFFSTIPQTKPAPEDAPMPAHLPNSRITTLDSTVPLAQMQTADSAKNLAVKGMFNVNSTSVDAWKALLGGARFSAQDGGSNWYRRSLHQTKNKAIRGESPQAYAGYRELTDSQINTLAQKIVEQVKLRGPFLSLSHFINRIPTAANADSNSVGLKGALQAAIDEAGINDIFSAETVSSSFNSAVQTIYADPQAALSQRATAVPGWLTQADILQVIGNALSARSDTFIIRAYGETLSPTTREVEGKAWCEAVVQRMPEFTDPAQTDPATDPAVLSAINREFGRKFRVLSFRWLSEDEI